MWFILINLQITCCIVLQMRLREVNYLAQSHTASTWQKHHLEPRSCVSDASVPNTLTLLPLFLFMKIAVQL